MLMLPRLSLIVPLPHRTASQRRRLAAAVARGAAFVLLALAGLATPAWAQTTLFVDADATGAEDGTAWADAYTSLQDALDAAATTVAGEPDTEAIWVAAGTYYPDEGASVTDDDRSASFALLADVAVYGGFDGTDGAGAGALESTLFQRNVLSNPTFLSGDIEQDDPDPDGDGIIAEGDLTGGNSFHVVTVPEPAGSPPPARLDGFIVTAGLADGSFPDNAGGGLFSDDAPVVVVNTTFSGNRAVVGGGAHVRDGGKLARFVNVTFSGNRSTGDGGGVLCFSRNLELTNVAVFGNVSEDEGAGLDINQCNNARLAHVTVALNQTDGRGGGLNVDATGVSLVNAIVWGNTAGTDGPQIYVGNARSATLDFVLLDGGCAAIFENGTGTATCTADILTDDPRFAPPARTAADAPFTDADLRLRNGSGVMSPAIDAGDDGQIPADVADLDLDDNTTEDVPFDLNLLDRVQSVDGGGTDLGAYESDGGVLPVEFAHVAATQAAGGVVLQWTTLSETANAGFAVERALQPSAGPAGAFVEVGFVPGAGTTTAPQTYRFADDRLPAGPATVRYRLRQRDFDGATTLSPTVEVRLDVAAPALHPVAPHPVRGAAAVRYTLPTAERIDLAVYDVLGRRVATLATGRQAAGTHTARLDGRSWPSGVYLVRLLAGGRAHTQRVTVVR